MRPRKQGKSCHRIPRSAWRTQEAVSRAGSVFPYDTGGGLRARIASTGAVLEREVSDPSGGVILAAHSYTMREGDYASSAYTWIHLCRGGGALRRFSSAQRLDGSMRRGAIGLAAPMAAGDGFWPTMRLLSLGLSPSRIARLAAETQEALAIEFLASRFHDDPLLPAILAEMEASAGEHGLSTAFFDHALGVVAHRLARLAARPVRYDRATALTRYRLRLVSDFVDAQLDGNISVAELAAVVNLSPYHFSRCFRAATGCAPFAFITRRRMERAMSLLGEGCFSVTEVAGLVGYANPSQFSAAFKRHVGQSSSQICKANCKRSSRAIEAHRDK